MAGLAVTVAPVPEARLHECPAIAREAFGFAERDLVPAWHMLAVTHHGGLVLGAFHGDELIGYSYAFPAFGSAGAYLYATGLQVRQRFWSHGVGRALKHAQRDAALRLGYDRIAWTVDALSSRALHLYLDRLGAAAVALQRRPYAGVLAGATADELEILWPLAGWRQVPEPSARVEIPWDVRTLERDAPAEARRWRAAAGDAMAGLFARGLLAVAVDLDRDHRRSFVAFADGRLMRANAASSPAE